MFLRVDWSILRGSFVLNELVSLNLCIIDVECRRDGQMNRFKRNFYRASVVDERDPSEELDEEAIDSDSKGFGRLAA